MVCTVTSLTECSGVGPSRGKIFRSPEKGNSCFIDMSRIEQCQCIFNIVLFLKWKTYVVCPIIYFEFSAKFYVSWLIIQSKNWELKYQFIFFSSRWNIPRIIFVYIYVSEYYKHCENILIVFLVTESSKLFIFIFS